MLAPLLSATLLVLLTNGVDEVTGADQSIIPSAEVSQFLEQHGLPGGLLPNLVTSYSLSGSDNSSFVVNLQHDCYHKFDNLVWYDTTISGKLGFGKIESLSGIQAQAFFWLPVTGIRVDGSNRDYIIFEVGFVSKRLSASLFQEPPSCSKKSSLPDLDLAAAI